MARMIHVISDSFSICPLMLFLLFVLCLPEFHPPTPFWPLDHDAILASLVSDELACHSEKEIMFGYVSDINYMETLI